MDSTRFTDYSLFVRKMTFAATSCGHLVISPQLLQQRLRQRPQLAAGAAEGHGDARIEHVAQLAEDDALLVTAQRRERHRGPRAARLYSTRVLLAGVSRNRLAGRRTELSPPYAFPPR